MIAGAVVKAMTAPRPRTRDPIGGYAKLLTRLQRVLPDRAMDALFLRMLGLDRASSSASSTTVGV